MGTCKPKTCKLNRIQRFILKELSKNREGLRVIALKKILEIKGRTLYYNLNKLRNLGIIENIYPIWKLCKDQKEYQIIENLELDQEIELHNISFLVKLIDKPLWWKNKEKHLMKLKGFEFKNIKANNNAYFQLKNKGFYIRFFSDSIFFISNKDYFGKDAYDCFMKATKDFIKTFDYLEEKLRFKFFHEGVPQVSITSSHYVKLNDFVAEYCKKINGKFEVRINGKLKLWVDMSKPLGMESSDADCLDTYQKHVEDIMVHKPLKNSELESLMIRVTKNQEQIQKTNLEYERNIKSHINAMKDLGFGIREFTNVARELKSLLKPSG
jgi:hypothetical protein